MAGRKRRKALEERRRGEEEREKKLEEEKKKRERNVVWRDLDGDSEEERLWLAEEILEKTLRREVGIRDVRERGKVKGVNGL